MKYKQMITDVFIFSNGMVAVTDQNEKQIPFFQGKRNFRTMKRIKDRIKRQKTPITWHAPEGWGLPTS